MVLGTFLFARSLICIQAYEVAKVTGPRNHWPVQGPSNEALIFYDAGISAKLRSCRFVTSQLNVTETYRTNFSSLLFY